MTKIALKISRVTMLFVGVTSILIFLWGAITAVQGFWFFPLLSAIVFSGISGLAIVLFNFGPYKLQGWRGVLIGLALACLTAASLWYGGKDVYRKRFIRGHTQLARYAEIQEKHSFDSVFFEWMPPELSPVCENPRLFYGTAIGGVSYWLQVRCSMSLGEAERLRDSFQDVAIHTQKGAPLPANYLAMVFRDADNKGFAKLEDSFELFVLKGTIPESKPENWVDYSSAGIAIDAEKGEVIYWIHWHWDQYVPDESGMGSPISQSSMVCSQRANL